MKNLASLSCALFCMLGGSNAHYIFNKFDTATTTGALWDSVRQHKNGNSPVTDLSSTDLRCNLGALDGSSTTVRNMKAGEKFTFTLDTAVYHQGPTSVFLSKAPSSVKSYAGDGKWAKVADIGPTFASGGASWQLSQSYSFNLPTCLPDGEYLLRIQQLGIHNPYPAGIPQFYLSCAQIKVTGGSATGSWNPTLSIPGAFSASDPGYTVNIYNPDFKSYSVPGGSPMKC